MKSHYDIRVGALVSANSAPSVISQILPHGFESFSLTFWQNIDMDDWANNAAQVKESVGDAAIVSSLAYFGNPLQNEDHAAGFEQCIDNAHLYGCDLVAGFTGAIEGEPLPNSMPQFTKVWGELAKRAEDKGVRIAFKNCNMDGTGKRPNITSPIRPARRK